MYEELGIGFVENSRLRFVDQVAPDDTPWIPSQRAIKQNGQTLRDTGRLMNSMTHVVHPDGVEYGTDTPYAGYLHDGTSRMPARPIVGFSADDEEFALNVITAFIQRSLGGKS